MDPQLQLLFSELPPVASLFTFVANQSLCCAGEACSEYTPAVMT